MCLGYSASRLFGVFQPVRLSRPALDARPAPHVGAAKAPDTSRKASLLRENRHACSRDPEPLSDIRSYHELGLRIDAHPPTLTQINYRGV
jgi:hypothetical protein